MRPAPRIELIIVFVGALFGLVFASASTSDFALHLDRQVHDVHCSFVPGAAPETGESGCQVTLVSPYSSVFRRSVWGGIPVSLPAMAVFAFLLVFSTELWLSQKQEDARATGFLVAATALPALTSVVMGYLSIVALGAACKMCIGIYISSAICVGGATALFVRARKGAHGFRPKSSPRPRKPSRHEPAWASPGPPTADPVEDSGSHWHTPGTHGSSTSWGYLGAAFGVGVLFVLVPIVIYAATAPDHSNFVGACGLLEHGEEDRRVLIPVAPQPGKVPAIEVLDPLCPACRGFEEALESSQLGRELDRKAVLFPLDNTCNWMVDAAVHPGACAVSYAVLCAESRTPEVLKWAFDNQEAIREAAASDPTAAERLVTDKFPELRQCMKSGPTKARLNRSLRWAVKNRLPVLTPQLYVGGVKLCDEDVDLGLEFALSRMISAHRDGTLKELANARTKDTTPVSTFEEEREAEARRRLEEEAQRPRPTPAAGSESESGESDEGKADSEGSPAGEAAAGSEPSAESETQDAKAGGAGAGDGERSETDAQTGVGGESGTAPAPATGGDSGSKSGADGQAVPATPKTTPPEQVDDGAAEGAAGPPAGAAEDDDNADQDAPGLEGEEETP